MVRFWCSFNVKLYWFVVANKRVKVSIYPFKQSTQSVPRCKHFSSRLQKPIGLCSKWQKLLFVL